MSKVALNSIIYKTRFYYIENYHIENYHTEYYHIENCHQDNEKSTKLYSNAILLHIVAYHCKYHCISLQKTLHSKSSKEIRDQMIVSYSVLQNYFQPFFSVIKKSSEEYSLIDDTITWGKERNSRLRAFYLNTTTLNSNLRDAIDCEDLKETSSIIL